MMQCTGLALSGYQCQLLCVVQNRRSPVARDICGAMVIFDEKKGRPEGRPN